MKCQIFCIQYLQLSQGFDSTSVTKGVLRLHVKQILTLCYAHVLAMTCLFPNLCRREQIFIYSGPHSIDFVCSHIMSYTTSDTIFNLNTSFRL